MLQYKDEAGFLFSELTEDNFVLFAVRNYSNPVCAGIEEFYDDLGKIRYIKRQITKYYIEDEINERLFLNNMITFFNVFEHRAAIIMLFHKMGREYWGIIKTVAIFLGFMTEDELPEIEQDIFLKEKLEAL